MESLASSRLDLDMAGMLVANFLQSWLQAGLAQQPHPQQLPHDIQDPTPPSPEYGLCVSAPIDHGPGAPSPGEHRQAIRPKGRSPEPGWQSDQIRVLDQDLGLSGTQTNKREDFKTLAADVSLEKVGAVFALEASRLSRSCSDWHRMLEICALTGTLLVDQDGCYDPVDFNDQLLLGLKGTMSQAERLPWDITEGG